MIYTEEHDNLGGNFISEAGKGVRLKITEITPGKTAMDFPKMRITMVNEAGQKVNDDLMETNTNTEKRFVWFLKAVGYPLKHGQEVTLDSINDKFIGKTLRADVEMDEPKTDQNGKTVVYPKITFDGYRDYPAGDQPAKTEAPKLAEPPAPEVSEDEEGW